MTTSWQRRRAAFNHDWLKNRFLTALPSFLNLLDHYLEDPDLERSFVATVLPQWETHRAEALTLGRDFLREMSPAVFFESSPLVQFDPETGQWLGALIDQLWRTRYPVQQWVDAVTKRVEEADESYETLQKALRVCCNTTSVAALCEHRDLFAAFEQRCQALAQAIETFPSRILVT